MVIRRARFFFFNSAHARWICECDVSRKSGRFIFSGQRVFRFVVSKTIFCFKNLRGHERNSDIMLEMS